MKWPVTRDELEMILVGFLCGELFMMALLLTIAGVR